MSNVNSFGDAYDIKHGPAKTFYVPQYISICRFDHSRPVVTMIPTARRALTDNILMVCSLKQPSKTLIEHHFSHTRIILTSSLSSFIGSLRTCLFLLLLWWD